MMRKLLLTLSFLINVAVPYNIMMYMPCFGGHFGTMSSLLGPICSSNNCTVVETAKSCEKKLSNFRETISFRTIKTHSIRDNYDFNGKIDFILNYCDTTMAEQIKMHAEVSNLLESHRGPFDLFITDFVMTAAIIAAENENIPVILQVPGIPTGVENLADKWDVPLVDFIVLKWAYQKCLDWFAELRTTSNLPALDLQGNFIGVEYSSRFPSLIPTSPVFYPEPHRSIECLYIGGPRNDSNYRDLDENLEFWISQDNLGILYISLGTHYVLEDAIVNSFVEKIRNQNQYRAIWALSSGLRDVIERLGLKSDRSIWFSGFLPQFTLLGNPRVKVFVTHCGLGSVIDLIKREIPSVFVPQFADQFSNAKQLQVLSAGISIDEFSFDAIDSAVQNISQNYQFYEEKLEIISDDFSKYEDKEKLQSFIEEVANRKKTTVIYQLEFQINAPRFHFWWKVCWMFIYFFLTTAIVVAMKLLLKLKSTGRPPSKKMN